MIRVWILFYGKRNPVKDFKQRLNTICSAFFWKLLKGEKQTLYINAHMWNLEKWHRYKCKCRSRIDTQKYQQTCGHGAGKEGEMGHRDWHSYTTMCKMESCCITQGAQLSALWWSRGMAWGGGGSRGRGYMYTYSWFTLLYSTNLQNIVKQLYSNNNILKINKMNPFTGKEFKNKIQI